MTHDGKPSGALYEDEIEVPGRLSFSRNHMWMDVGEDGVIHIGVDSFMARALGKVDKLKIPSGSSRRRPAVILRIGAVDLPIVFPCRLGITRTNKALEENPSILCDDPYGAGWIFEHMPPPSNGRRSYVPRLDLISGVRAERWMREETDRMTEFLTDLGAEENLSTPLVADGGIFRKQIARELSCPDLILLFNLFFSPLDLWKR